VSRIPCFTSTTLLYHVSQSLIQYNLVLHLWSLWMFRMSLLA
jgi:hypothetical protein